MKRLSCALALTIPFCLIAAPAASQKEGGTYGAETSTFSQAGSFGVRNFAISVPGASCGSRNIVVERLATGFGETRQSIGLAPNNSVVEVYASQETGTWTITVTNPAGITCLVASGQSYENVDEDLAAPGDDT